MTSRAHTMRCFFSFSITCLLFLAPLPVLSMQFEASIDKNKMTLDEDVTVTIQVSGEDVQDNVPFPAIQESPDFKFVNKNNYQNSSQNITVINGRFKKSIVRTVTFQFVFKPVRIGECQLPSFAFNYNNTQKNFAGSKIQVLKESPESADIDFFFTFSKNKLFVNEQMVLTAVLRKKAGSAVNQIKRPEIEKNLSRYFWMKPVTDKVEGKIESVNGQNYEVYRISFIAFPVLAGTIKIPSVPLEYTVVERRRQQNRDPFFNDAFFNSFFDNATTKTKTKYSSPVTLEVKDLPSLRKPADFQGAVGVFSIAAMVDKTNIKAGEALNLKVTVSGRGNEKSFNAVHIKNIDRFEVFDPEITATADVKGGEVRITKIFKYVLIPQVEGAYSIGPITLYYFNPDRGVYDSAQTEIAISVKPGKVSRTSGERYLSKEEIKLVGKDIQYIKTSAGRLTDQSKRLYREPLFALLTVFPFLFTLVFALVQRQRERLETDIEYARMKKARKKAARLLAGAGTPVAHSAGGEFFATINKSLSGYIADKLNLAAAGLTNDMIRETLLKRGVGNVAVDEVLGFFNECDLYRFGSMSASETERRAQYRKAEALITRLEKELK